MADMTATVLIDNISRDSLCCEWGLAIHIAYRGRSILLDTGTTGDFAKNATALGISLADVEYGVLSHAHYDHSDGMETFFAQNDSARFFVREGTAEDCYSYKEDGDFYKYIGVRQGLLETWRDRIRYVSGDYELCPGAVLVPHKTPGLAKIGRRAGMYRRIAGCWQTDDFRHEQSLVLDTCRGLVIFNSCSHGGADNIIREAAATFPDRQIYAIVGGFHLYRSSREEVLRLARLIEETGIRRVVTGHCTGDEGYLVLKEVLGEKLEQLYSGYVLEL